MRPNSVNILGKVYSISYVDRPSDVDIRQHESLWGQISYWDRTIRVYDNGRNLEDIWHSIIHEVLHGISTSLNIKILEANESDIDLLALSLTDVFFRNNWLNLNLREPSIKTLNPPKETKAISAEKKKKEK